MADEHLAPDAFKNRCVNVSRTLQSCVGYFIDRITLDDSHADVKENTLDVWLREGPWKPDAVISLSGIRSVRPWSPKLGGAFIDEIALTHLPTLPAPWSADAVDRLERTKDLPELVWLRIIGPVGVDAVASTVTVYRAASDNEASMLNDQPFASARKTGQREASRLIRTDESQLNAPPIHQIGYASTGSAQRRSGVDPRDAHAQDGQG